MALCRKCIIPDSYPDITFEDGLCSFCRVHEKAPHVNRSYKGEELLREKLTSQGANPYHCLVPLSGGKDSSYAIMHLVKKLGLKPLAAHFDSGFIDEKTKSNIEKITSSLGVDLVIGRATPFRKKMIQESFAMAKYGPRYGGVTGVGGLCVNCENSLRSFAINEARTRNIPFIIWSSTDFEDAPDAFLKGDDSQFKVTYGSLSDRFNMKRVKKIYEGIVGDYRVLKYFWNLPFMYHGLRHFCHKVNDNRTMKNPERYAGIDPFTEVSFLGKGIEVVYFYEYIAYDPYRHIEALNREIGWETLMGKETRQDCKLHHLLNYRGYKRNHITNDGFFLSVLVREGLLDREKAIQKEQSVVEKLEENVRQLLKDLEASVAMENLQ
ncbi:MAG: hypothetical protein RDV48_13365 [Candidatus Eremiobacteraeota bacterium]|nr:hypothetical protein [Candidatus Eremiobacteraeota bacterium]